MGKKKKSNVIGLKSKDKIRLKNNIKVNFGQILGSTIFE